MEVMAERWHLQCQGEVDPKVGKERLLSLTKLKEAPPQSPAIEALALGISNSPSDQPRRDCPEACRILPPSKILLCHFLPIFYHFIFLCLICSFLSTQRFSNGASSAHL